MEMEEEMHLKIRDYDGFRITRAAENSTAGIISIRSGKVRADAFNPRTPPSLTMDAQKEQ